MRRRDHGLRLAVSLVNADERTPTGDALRRIFDAAVAGDRRAAAAGINALIAGADVVPRLVEQDDQRVRLEFVPHEPGSQPRLAAEAAIALALLVTDAGFERLRVCASPRCRRVLVDLTRNGSRRFCDRRCANRQHAAAYRSRQSPPPP